MKVYRSLAELPQPAGRVVATIGNFDGVHVGHRWVIAEVIARARARAVGGRSLAITFDPHPGRVLRPEVRLPLITPLDRKLELLATTGIDMCLVLPFTEDFLHMTARAFAADVLRDAVGAVEVHEGENFRFGYRAEAGVHGSDGLEALGRELGFAVRVYTPRRVRGAPVSSSRIRGLIAEGAVSAARALLGAPFAIDSTAAPGRGYGTKYAVPTINLTPYAELLPANGVYVTLLEVGTGAGAEMFEGVTNVGNRPTFGADSFAVETHLLDFHAIDLDAATPLRLTFLRRLRGEVRWPSPEALRAQIGKDVTQAKRYLSLGRRMTARGR